MKIYINSINEDWIIDRLIKEWNQFNFPQQKYILEKRFNMDYCSMDMEKNSTVFLKSKKFLHHPPYR